MQRLVFPPMFRELECISVKCKYHVTGMVLDGSVRIGCYIIKELVTCAAEYFWAFGLTGCNCNESGDYGWVNGSSMID